MKTTILYAVALTVCAVISTHAQIIQEGNNTNAWYMYFGNHHITNDWGLHLEAQFRRSGIIEHEQQLLLRGGVNYYLNPTCTFTAGYGYIHTNSYGETPVSNPFPEHRIWEQIQLNTTLNSLNFVHRVRLEQRYIGVPNHDTIQSWRYANRFRLQERINIPLQGETIDNNELYIGAYNELFLNFGLGVNQKIFDQNRAYIALGYQIPSLGRIELGYLNQYIVRQSATSVTLEQNHTLQLGLLCNVSL